MLGTTALVKPALPAIEPMTSTSLWADIQQELNALRSRVLPLRFERIEPFDLYE